MQHIDMSVIVTVYNIEQYIGECIESILQEKRLNIELILVDDASTDGSLQICSKFESGDSRVRTIHNAINLGITSSRNVGLRAATGEYFYVMDGDDLLKPDSLYKMYEICKENDLDMLEFSADVLYENEDMRTFAKESEYKRTKILNKVEDGPTMFADLFYSREERKFSAYLHCYKGEHFRRHDLYWVEGLRYADGSEFKLYLAAERVMCIEDAFYIRRVRGDSQITSRPKIYYLESLIILFIEEMKLWEKNRFSEYINEGIEMYFLWRNREILDMYQQFIGDDSETFLLNQHPMAKYYYNYVLKKIPICVHVFTQEELDIIKAAPYIYIYGAGFYGEQVSMVLDYFGIENYDFIVSCRNENPQYKRDKKVYELKEIRFEKKDLVILALAEKHHKEIERNLVSQNCGGILKFIV